jgi:hypothetical protein
MAKTGRNAAVALAVAGALMGAPRASVAAGADATTNTTLTSTSHVRSANPAIVSLMAQATERSATFRRLVQDIDASDSYVYVNEGKCGHGVRACFVSVTASKANRFMRVVVDMRKADWDLMGSIGHELRHTLEVIGEPSVRDNTAKYFFYEQIGTHSVTGAHETEAATDAGNTVRSEVQKFIREARSE